MMQYFLKTIYNKEIEYGQKNNLKYRFENKDLVLYNDDVEIIFWVIKDKKIKWCVEIYDGKESKTKMFNFPSERLKYVKDFLGGVYDNKQAR